MHRKVFALLKDLKYLNKYLWKYKWRLLAGIFFVSVANIFGVIPPMVVRHAFNLIKDNINLYQSFSGLSGQHVFYTLFVKSILYFSALVIILAICKGLFMFFMRQTIIVMSRFIEYDLRNEMYAHYQSLDQSFYKSHNTGDLMSRVSEDVSRVRMYLGPGIMYTINTLVLFIMVIAVMINVNAELTFYVLTPLPILAISIFYVMNIINRKSERIQRQLSRLTTMAQEVFSGIRVVKSYAAEKRFGNLFDSESDIYKSRSLDLKRVEALFFPIILLMIGFSTLLTIYIGGIQVMQGKISTGNIVEFIMYVSMLTWPVTSLGWIASLVQRAAASQKRINEFLQTKSALTDGHLHKDKVLGHIELKNLSFTYPETGVKAIKNISFKISKGQKVAIVGKTGSGKSTLADLILRMYDPDEGCILLDHQPLSDYQLSGLRAHIAYVPQDVFLFSDTIAHNIDFGTRQSDADSIKTAAIQAAVDEEIMQLPEAYQTRLGERGVTLSGGQKQRISIARAFIQNRQILILDDCLSALDTLTEERILHYLKEVLSDKTAIIITHRIASPTTFDQILVLDQGCLVEQGTHESLMKQKSYYYKLYEKQKIEEKLI